jgi:N-acetylglucosaminyldiphosphoundecaprenol N-acetyl-beta-D-mannosaminyltransferase
MATTLRLADATANHATFADRNGIEITSIGHLPIAVIDREASAEVMIRAALDARGERGPALFITSANGQVISECARSPALRELFISADLIHADGMPLVFASRIKGRHPLPERVATTDLFHDVARLAEKTGTSFYLLGASAPVIERTAARVRAMYPGLKIAGYRNGYWTPDEEDDVIAEINDTAPDILWVGMGVPREIMFSVQNRSKLTNVGLIKTSGGLFDFLSGKSSRAPEWMQAAGLEWFYRLSLEPRRLIRRYASTNLHAAYLLLSARSSDRIGEQ